MTLVKTLSFALALAISAPAFAQSTTALAPTATLVSSTDQKIEELAKKVDELTKVTAEQADEIKAHEALKTTIMQWMAIIAAVAGLMGYEIWKTIRGVPELAKKKIEAQLGEIGSQLAEAAGVIDTERKVHNSEIIVLSPDGNRELQVDLMNHGFKTVKMAEKLDPTAEVGALVVIDVSRMEVTAASKFAEEWLAATWRSRAVVYFPTSKGQLAFQNRALFAEKARPANNEDTLYMHVTTSLRRMAAFNEVIGSVTDKKKA